MSNEPSVIFYDTETTGIPDWKLPSEDPCQPHVVQIACILCAADGTEIESFEAIVKPEGWIIPSETAEIHGITTERAMDEGHPAEEVLDQFMAMWGRAGLRVGHNEMFDRRMLRIMIKRHGHGPYRGDHNQIDRDDQSDFWNEAPDFCTMYATRADIGGRIPKLGVALKHYTGEEQSAAHSAMGDAVDCRKVFLALKARGCVPTLEEIIAKKQAKRDAKMIEKAGARR